VQISLAIKHESNYSKDSVAVKLLKPSIIWSLKMPDTKSAEQIAQEAADAAAQKKAASEAAKAAKAEAAAQAKAAKEAAAAAAKVLKDQAAAEAKAKKETEAAAKNAEKAAKAEAAAKAKAEVAATKTKVVMPSNNGITRPKDGSKTGQVWAIADALSKAKKGPVAIAELQPECAKAGLNDATTRTQYARWKTFNGVFGVVAKTPVAPVVTAEPVLAQAA
jgi:membrane protein involved in colicin uptake